MKNLTNESRYLLYVIRNAVKQQKIDPPSEALNWDEFFCSLKEKRDFFACHNCVADRISAARFGTKI